MRNPSEAIVHHGGPSSLLATLTRGDEDQKAQRERESVFKQLECRGTYAAATAAAGKSLDTNDILIQDSPMHPMRIGDFFSIAVPSEFYIKQLAKFRFSLIGRILLNKGVAPVSVVHLKPILEERWKIFDDWNLVSLGRGFYTLQFSSKRDQKWVASTPIWNFSRGAMHIRERTPGCDPFKLNPLTAPVWVQIYKLPYEFWHSDLIAGIDKAIGNLLKIDSTTASGVFGQFARLLVEVDFQTNLQETDMIDRGEKSFFVELFYENIPAFCTSCKQIRHEVTNCRKNTSFQVGDRSRDGKDTRNKPGVTSIGGGVRDQNPPTKGESTKVWVARTFGKGNITQIRSNVSRSS